MAPEQQIPILNAGSMSPDSKPANNSFEESHAVQPLRRKKADGVLYTRYPKNEKRIGELLDVPFDELIELCKNRDRDDPAYVPSECVLYFLRLNRGDTDLRRYEQIHKILYDRVIRRFLSGESKDGKTVALSESSIQDEAIYRFVRILSEDRKEYCEKLDFFEIAFDSAVKKMGIDVKRTIWRGENKADTLEIDHETGEFSNEVEQSARAYDPFDEQRLKILDYRSRLDAAIDTLPPEQQRIVHMLRQEIPINSIQPDAITIAKVLGKSDKTIRTHRDIAFSKLRAILSPEEKT